MSYTARDFSRKQIYEIAKLYSTGNYSYQDFMKEFGCSHNTFYAIINRAIIESIVSNEVMKAIELVAVFNSTNKLESETKDLELVRGVEYRGKRSAMCRRVKRLSYICPKKEAVLLIKQYINSPKPKVEFCKHFFITTRLFDRTLKHSIIYGWITLKTVELLRQKAYLFNDIAQVDEFFNELLDLRKRCKK